MKANLDQQSNQINKLETDLNKQSLEKKVRNETDITKSSMFDITIYLFISKCKQP